LALVAVGTNARHRPNQLWSGLNRRWRGLFYRGLDRNRFNLFGRGLSRSVRPRAIKRYWRFRFNLIGPRSFPRTARGLRKAIRTRWSTGAGGRSTEGGSAGSGSACLSVSPGGNPMATNF
jgi:hypothetical protein